MNNTLQFEIGFEEDPDKGAAVSPEESASWGWFKFMVGDRNLCRHIVNSQVSDRIHWYLLPMFEWFVENWDSLLHETKMPSSFADALSAREGFRSFNPYKSTGDNEADISDRYTEEEESAVFDWAERHSLRASADGGIFPNLFLRRIRNEVEISWGHSRVQGGPDDLRFLAQAGQANLDPRETADRLFTPLKQAVKILCDKVPQSARLSALSANLRGLEEPRSIERAAWMAGIGPSVQASMTLLEKLTKEVMQMHRDLIVPANERLIISHAPAAVLMFGSLSPNVDEQDVRTLLNLLEGAARDNVKGSQLPKLDQIESSSIAHEQGYALANMSRKAMQIPETPFKVDLDDLFSRYGIAKKEVELSDTKVRAIAIRGKQLRPLIAVNHSCKHNESEPGLRFTLAHELCHLLFDEEEGVPLAVASGPWAAATIEKRANAFAAMFLMAEDSCRRLLNQYREGEELTTSVIAEISAAFGTGKLATLRHLWNLGLMDSAEFNDLEEQLVN